MNPTEIFIEAVRASRDLPPDVRAHATHASGVGESRFDDTYLQFLDEQIHLSPRGPEWTAILRRRRDGLRPFCGVTLLSGRIRAGAYNTWVKVDPQRRTVVFWEQLPDDTTA
jgi:hypothetical protein